LQVVNFSLAMFVISSYLYRKVVEEVEVNCLVVVLLPEIVMDVVLAVILANKVVTAYLVLLFSILGFSTIVVLHSLYALWTDKDSLKVGEDDTGGYSDVEKDSAIAICSCKGSATINNLRKDIVRYIREEGDASEYGANIQEVVHRLVTAPSSTLTEESIWRVVDELAEEGRIFAAISEDYYKCACF